MEKTHEESESTFEDELTQTAEALIIKGKDHGHLTPDDILESFPRTEAEPVTLRLIAWCAGRRLSKRLVEGSARAAARGANLPHDWVRRHWRELS